MTEHNHAYQWIWGGLHWPPLGFKFTPITWGLYAVYRWTLWVPFLEVRAWVPEGDVSARVSALNAHREVERARVELTEHNEV